MISNFPRHEHHWLVYDIILFLNRLATINNCTQKWNYKYILAFRVIKTYLLVRNSLVRNKKVYFLEIQTFVSHSKVVNNFPNLILDVYK